MEARRTSIYSKLFGVLSGLLLVFALGLAGCGTPEASAPEESEAETTGLSVDEALAADSADGEESDESEADQGAEGAYDATLSGRGLTTAFIGKTFYDKTIKDESDAIDAVQSVIDRIGGDETTKLELLEIRPTETGTTYYTFRQRAGDVVVNGASVKLVANKDGEACGLISAILPDVQLEDLEAWNISAEDAEQTVLAACAEDGYDSVAIVKDATEQTLIALSDGSEIRRYAWVVYTNNLWDDVDAAYLAHYVGAKGDYLYSIPVSEPSNADSLAGDEANFDFDSYEAGTWSGTVTTYDGSTRDVTVPVLTDLDTGSVILGDAKRKILCVDYASFDYDEVIDPRVEGEDGFADNELLVYDAFIKVWDFFDSIGWTGPDGEGTPSLLRMDWVDSEGEIFRNACYSGRSGGFQTFAFNRLDPDGECFDIMAHEFTHCVTGTTMTANLYFNDEGAINEGMSDVIGNLVEMLIAYDEDGAWIIGENEGEDGPYRSMKAPHDHHQPEFAWDVYYGPAASEPTVANDQGGVHINSSLLNFISYKLDQAGMKPEDQLYYWMNVALAMTPSTDYPQIAQILPWCMEQSGYGQYVDAVKKAVEEGCLTSTEAPSVPPEGSGYIKIELPEETAVDVNDMRFQIVASGDDDPPMAWMGADADFLTATVPAGDYTCEVYFTDGDKTFAKLCLTDEGWKQLDEDAWENHRLVTLAAGDTVVLPGDGLEVDPEA